MSNWSLQNLADFHCFVACGLTHEFAKRLVKDGHRPGAMMTVTPQASGAGTKVTVTLPRPQPDPNAGMIERDGRSMTQREEFRHACVQAQVAAKRLGDSLEQMARKQPPPGIDIVAPMDGRLGRFREPI